MLSVILGHLRKSGKSSVRGTRATLHQSGMTGSIIDHFTQDIQGIQGIGGIGGLDSMNMELLEFGKDFGMMNR